MIVMNDNDIAKTFNAWVTYQGLYAHFTREYDYFKYNGKGNWNSIDSMERSFAKQESRGNFSAQRKLFKDIGRQFKDRESLIFFYLSQFSHGMMYPTVFDSDVYDEYKDRMNNFNFYLKEDMEQIMKCMREHNKTFDELFHTTSMNHPYILKLSLSRIISLETFTVLDIILNFIPNLSKKLNDPIWYDHKNLVINYKPFMSFDIDVLKKIIIGAVMKG